MLSVELAWALAFSSCFWLSSLGRLEYLSRSISSVWVVLKEKASRVLVVAVRPAATVVAKVEDEGLMFGALVAVAFSASPSVVVQVGWELVVFEEILVLAIR